MNNIFDMKDDIYNEDWQKNMCQNVLQTLFTLWFWPAWLDDPGHKVVQIVAGDAVAVRERVPGGGQGSLPPAQESMIELVMEFIELNWSNEKR